MRESIRYTAAPTLGLVSQFDGAGLQPRNGVSGDAFILIGTPILLALYLRFTTHYQITFRVGVRFTYRITSSCLLRNSVAAKLVQPPGSELHPPPTGIFHLLPVSCLYDIHGPVQVFRSSPGVF
jgi:hypothetical protein